jgi:DNA-binding beta-propeller fold protein YncE
VKNILLGCNAKGPPVVNGVGTGPQNSVIINQNNGTVIAVLDNLGGADQVWFNPGDGHYFLAESSNAAGHLLGVVDSNSHQADQTISVMSTASPHSVAVDPILNQVYVPVSNGVNVYATSGPED